jgi:hypothetical protein
MNFPGFVLALALAGCAAVQQAVQPGGGVVDGIVAEALAAARAPAAEQAAVLGKAQQASSSGAAADRLRLATLLATLPAPLRDDARAAELLQPLADAAAPGVGRFAALLASQIGERQRLMREMERAARERERSDKERERADKERDKREEALRQQLEALRAIERGILEREEKMRRRQQ